MHYENFSVSVIMPAFNAEKYIAEAIHSVLQQTSPAKEIIIVDDGSTDGTREIVEKYSAIRYVHQSNAGVAAALNRGCLLATSNHIAFISADDLWHPDKLQKQTERLSESPHSLVFGHMMNFVSPDLTPSEAANTSCPKDPMPAYSAGTLLTRIETLNKVGLFNPDFEVGEFVDWYGRAKDLQIDVVMLDDVVSLRRVHNTNHSKTAIRNHKSYAPVLKAMLDRRRAMAEGRH
jgi:glycosyltransferase involved in cell wall biosynthesis